MSSISGNGDGGSARKRTSNACVRCRRQKIKCSGLSPCEQCSRRQLRCVFDDKQQKVLVSRSFIDDLERQASLYRQGVVQYQHSRLPPSHSEDSHGPRSSSRSRKRQRREGEFTRSSTTSPGPDGSSARSPSTQLLADQADVAPASDSEEPHPDAVPVSAEAHLANPLVSGDSPAYTTDCHGRPFYLGTSSNWSFGRRVLSMAHERVTGHALPAHSLLFEGSTYTLGWDGKRHAEDSEPPVLPTLDFASYLINAVKFHCGQLYHLFDEATFMERFHRFHRDPQPGSDVPTLWYSQYLIILAFGKAFTARGKAGSKPPGAEFFVHAMKIMPDITFLCVDPIPAMEVLCTAALYLQCLDHRSAAYNLIGQAVRIAVEQGMHTDDQAQHLDERKIERCRQIWWTCYILDRQMSSLLGAPVMFADESVTAQLPSFSGSLQTTMALNIQVKLSRATSVILNTVYGSATHRKTHLLNSMKEAIRAIASANDERKSHFPLDLTGQGALSRLAAHLHLLHHQCIILTTRPLLFSFWQKRLASIHPLRVTSSGGARALLSVCAGSSMQSINILRALQSQGLLESFLPFDLQAVFSSAIVISLAKAVDPSLIKDNGPWLETCFEVLEEMAGRGNLIASFHLAELKQLNENIRQLPSNPDTGPSQASTGPASASRHMSWGEITADVNVTPSVEATGPLPNEMYANNWNIGDGLSGEELRALADSLEFGLLDWMDPAAATF